MFEPTTLEKWCLTILGVYKMLRTVWDFLVSKPPLLWICLIIFGAVLFAVGNAILPSSQQEKETRDAERTIKETIKPELETNLKILQSIKQQLTNDAGSEKISANGFRTGAWSTISNGQLLLKLKDPDIRKQLLEVYGMIYDAKYYHQKLAELIIGLTGPPIEPIESVIKQNRYRNEYRQILSDLIKQIEPQLKNLLSTPFFT